MLYKICDISLINCQVLFKIINDLGGVFMKNKKKIKKKNNSTNTIVVVPILIPIILVSKILERKNKK